MTKKKIQSKDIRMASVSEILDESKDADMMVELYGELGSVEDPIEEVNTIKVRATRNFDQMRRGDTLVVDPKVSDYWSDNIRGGNLEVVE